MSVVVEPWDVWIGEYRLGPSHEWFCTQIDIGSAGFRTQDNARPRRDGRHFGRDYVDPGAWTLTVIPTGTVRGVELIHRLSRLAGAWWFDDRQVPGAYTSLHYELDDGSRRQVFGRPRGVDPDINGVADGTAEVSLVFDLMDATAYADTPHRLELELLPGSPAGLIFPAIAPFVFDSGNTSRQGMIHNTGMVPSPIRVAFSGPVVDPTIRSITHGWEINLNTTIAYDQTVTVDTRDMTVLRGDGASFAHTVTRHSSLGVMVAPGFDEIVFEGSDPTGTSRATVEWLTGLGPF